MYTLKMKLNQIKALNSFVAQTVKNNLRLGAAEAPKYINQVKEEVIYKRVSELNSWYTRVLGLDEVKLYQERVVSLQEKLLEVQERRRSIGQQLTEIRKKSNELQDQIHKVKRQDNLQRFLDLMRDETEILKVERDITNSFNDCDREEREVFTAFTNAVRDSHEKQRAQLEYTKYFGLILSVVGSFLTFCYSTLKKQELKRFVEEHFMLATGSSQPLLMQLQENQQQLNRVIKYIDSENPQVVGLINRNHKELMEVISDSNIVNLINKNKEGPNLLQNEQFSNVRNTSWLGNEFDSQKIVFYSCAALIGIVMIRAFIS